MQFFADTYEDLYLCVAFCATDMDSVKKDITLLCEWAGYGSDCKVTFADVEAVVPSLHSGKSDGYSGLMSDHIKSACDDLVVYVALLFSGMTDI